MADDYIEQIIKLMWKPAHVYIRTSILNSFLKDPRFYPFGNCNQHRSIGVDHLPDLNQSDVLYQYVLLAQERIFDHCSKVKRTEFKAVTGNLRLVMSSYE